MLRKPDWGGLALCSRVTWWGPGVARHGAPLASLRMAESRGLWSVIGLSVSTTKLGARYGLRSVVQTIRERRGGRSVALRGSRPRGPVRGSSRSRKGLRSSTSGLNSLTPSGCAPHTARPAGGCSCTRFLGACSHREGRPNSTLNRLCLWVVCGQTWARQGRMT